MVHCAIAPGSPKSGKDAFAMQLLGRLDEAEQAKVMGDTSLQRLLEKLAAGRPDEVRTLRSSIVFNRHHNTYSAWFGRGPGMAMIEVALGDAGALRKALEEGAKTPSGWGGRCALVCAAALDPAKEVALSAMQWRSEAKAWLLVAQAQGGELAGDRAALQANRLT